MPSHSPDTAQTDTQSREYSCHAVTRGNWRENRIARDRLARTHTLRPDISQLVRWLSTVARHELYETLLRREAISKAPVQHRQPGLIAIAKERLLARLLLW